MGMQSTTVCVKQTTSPPTTHAISCQLRLSRSRAFRFVVHQPVPLKKLSLHNLPLVLHLMHYERALWILPDQDDTLDRALLLSADIPQQGQQADEFPQRLLVSLFPLLDPLGRIFFLNVQHFSRSGLV